MQCPQCNTQLEDDTVFCGNCGTQIAPLKAQGATVTYKSGEGEDELATVLSTRPGSQTPTPQTPIRNNPFVTTATCSQEQHLAHSIHCSYGTAHYRGWCSRYYCSTEKPYFRNKQQFREYSACIKCQRDD